MEQGPDRVLRGQPIRMFRNLQGMVRGFAFPNNKAMGVFASIWDGSQRATEGGHIMID